MRKRVFIAINLPQKIKRELTDLLVGLKKDNRRAPIKWVRSEGLHITLHFLGYLDEDLLKEVKKEIARVMPGYSKKKLQLHSLGAFPNLERPRVIFVEVFEPGSRMLSTLQKSLGEVLGNLKIEVDHRPWQAHITLGRVKGYPVKLTKTDYQIANLDFEVKSIDLMASELQPEGAVYKIIESFSLPGYILSND